MWLRKMFGALYMLCQKIVRLLAMAIDNVIDFIVCFVVFISIVLEFCLLTKTA